MKIYVVSAVLFIVSNIGTSLEYEDISNVVPRDTKSTYGNIFITVSSLAYIEASIVTERQMELNWVNVEDKFIGALIGLFSRNPLEEVSNALATTTISASEGYFRTNVSFPYLKFDVKNLTNSCLDYWIALVHNGIVLTSNCYSIRPNWMYEMIDVIGDMTLLDLMIPGTHNAGSYMRYDPLNDNMKIKYMMCQDEDIENQLIYGNRFLDLRPAYRYIGKGEEEFWISHGLFRTNISIRSVLKAVKNFLDHTKEIVIIDFHEFSLGQTGPEEGRHRELMKLIISEVGDYALQRDNGYRKTIREILKMNKRLIIGYKDRRGDESLVFFPGVNHLWANTEKVNDLKKYFDARICNNFRDSLGSAMAQLTSSIGGIFLNLHGGLRKMAQNVNLNVTKWFRDEWWKCANIVATDYFLGNDIINVAIQANSRRHER